MTHPNFKSVAANDRLYSDIRFAFLAFAWACLFIASLLVNGVL